MNTLRNILLSVAWHLVWIIGCSIALLADGLGHAEDALEKLLLAINRRLS